MAVACITRYSKSSRDADERRQALKTQKSFGFIRVYPRKSASKWVSLRTSTAWNRSLHGIELVRIQPAFIQCVEPPDYDINRTFCVQWSRSGHAKSTVFDTTRNRKARIGRRNLHNLPLKLLNLFPRILLLLFQSLPQLQLNQNHYLTYRHSRCCRV